MKPTKLFPGLRAAILTLTSLSENCDVERQGPFSHDASQIFIALLYDVTKTFQKISLKVFFFVRKNDSFSGKKELLLIFHSRLIFP